MDCDSVTVLILILLPVIFFFFNYNISKYDNKLFDIYYSVQNVCEQVTGFICCSRDSSSRPSSE